MKRKSGINDESGAALISVIFIGILLVTACAFLLSAVGHNSRNSTDVLSETKAYYAAESGLQSAINVFRNKPGINQSDFRYSEAVANPDLSPWLGGTRITVGSGNASYEIAVDDPDNSGVSTTYRVDGEFLQADGYTYASTRTFGVGDSTTISFLPVTTTTVNHPLTAGTLFGQFRVEVTGAGATITDIPGLRFRVNYRMTAPRGATRSMRGYIKSDGTVEFDDYSYSLMGADNIRLCETSACISEGTAFPLTVPLAGGDSAQFYGKLDPLEPYRLRIVSTGFGPGSSASRKRLIAIVQKNFFNDLGSNAAISMIGPNAFFDVGTSAQMLIDGGSNPSITVTDTAGLTNVNSAQTNGTMTPPPELAGPDVPDWQQSTYAMDAFIQQLRQAAQNNGRYYDSSNEPNSFGDFDSGTGITFCERSCTMSGNTEGGGILVVTGTFYTSGAPSFNGLVLAVGRYVDDTDPGGVVRLGGGNEIFQGNIVIAPYDPLNLAAGWEQPRYDQSGGPGDTVNSDVIVDTAFDGTSAITDFIHRLSGGCPLRVRDRSVDMQTIEITQLNSFPQAEFRRFPKKVFRSSFQRTNAAR